MKRAAGAALGAMLAAGQAGAMITVIDVTETPVITDTTMDSMGLFSIYGSVTVPPEVVDVGDELITNVTFTSSFAIPRYFQGVSDGFAVDYDSGEGQFIEEYIPIEGSGYITGLSIILDNHPYYTNLPGNAGGTYSFQLNRVPEPVTWAMLLIGFGLTGFRLRLSASRTRYGPNYQRSPQKLASV